MGHQQSPRTTEPAFMAAEDRLSQRAAGRWPGRQLDAVPRLEHRAVPHRIARYAQQRAESGRIPLDQPRRDSQANAVRGLGRSHRPDDDRKPQEVLRGRAPVRLTDRFRCPKRRRAFALLSPRLIQQTSAGLLATWMGITAAETAPLAPVHEPADRAVVGPAGVGVADGHREEVDEAPGGPLIGGRRSAICAGR